MHVETITHTPAHKRTISGATYKALAFDKRISHGAFRLWHVLRDYAGQKMKCWPGQRRLTRDMGSNFEAIASWRDKLVETGWLKVRTGNRGGHIYELIPIPAATESGSAPLPKAVAVAATKSGNTTNGIKLTPGTHETNKPPLVIKDLHPGLTNLMADCRDVLGADEMKRCHRRWLGRAETKPSKLRSVLADTAQAAKDGEIKTTPARYAEHRWKEFAPCPRRQFSKESL